jgi:error-prone DNA polymerase
MPCDDLTRTADGRRVTVAGLIVVRQRPGTAKGTIFLTLEDETGIANIIVWAKVFEAHRAIVLGSRMVSVTGRMQSESGVIHVVADRIVNLTHLLGHLAADDAATALTPPGEAVRATDKGGGLPDLIDQTPHPANAPLPLEPEVAADLDVPARATRHVPARRRA